MRLIDADELKASLAELSERIEEAAPLVLIKGAIDLIDKSPTMGRKWTEKNVPLTLEELRQMNGQPVWIVEEPDWGHWELSADAEDYLTDRNPDFYGMRHNDTQGKYGLHKLGWLAYRRPIEIVDSGEAAHGQGLDRQ